MTNDQTPRTNSLSAGPAPLRENLPAEASRGGAEGAESPFLADVAAVRIDSLGIESLTEAWRRLRLALLRLENVIDRPGEMSRSERSREELVAIAATAWQAARDLGIEARADAIGKDIPF